MVYVATHRVRILSRISPVLSGACRSCSELFRVSLSRRISVVSSVYIVVLFYNKVATVSFCDVLGWLGIRVCASSLAISDSIIVFQLPLDCFWCISGNDFPLWGQNSDRIFLTHLVLNSCLLGFYTAQCTSFISTFRTDTKVEAAVHPKTSEYTAFPA